MPTAFTVDFRSQVSREQHYIARFAVKGAFSDDSVRYAFENRGQEVAIVWPGVLTETALGAAKKANDSAVRGGALTLGSDTAVQFTVSGRVSTVRMIETPLSVFTPERRLLYRDVHRMLAIVPGDR